MSSFSPLDEEINTLIARYQRQREEALEAQHKMQEISVTVTAPKRAVTVTVGPQGELTGLRFPTMAYRAMAPNELAALVMTTVEKARAKVLTEITELMSGVLPERLGAANLQAGRLTAEDFLPEQPPMPAPVARLLDKLQGAENEAGVA